MWMKREGKRVILLALMSIFLLAGCGKEQEAAAAGPAKGESDLAYIQSKGTLVAGITDFAPMDYREGGEWTGFDAELARDFAESLGVALEFKEIEWDDKTALLEKGEIDCIWNGMTMTQTLVETISCSEPYLSNAQVIVVHEEALKKYQTADECQHLLFAVEAGSMAEELLGEKRYRYTACQTQKEALQSVLDKKADATVIDVIMAAYNTADGQEFEQLGIAAALNDEKICVGFRRDSDLKEMADDFLRAAYEEGRTATLAKKYGIEDALLK